MNIIAKSKRKGKRDGMCKKSAFAKGACYYDDDEQSSLFSSASSINNNKAVIDIAVDK